MCVMVDDQVKDKSIRNVPTDLWKRVRHHAIDRGISVREIVIEALERYMGTEKE